MSLQPLLCFLPWTLFSVQVISISKDQSLFTRWIDAVECDMHLYIIALVRVHLEKLDGLVFQWTTKALIASFDGVCFLLTVQLIMFLCVSTLCVSPVVLFEMPLCCCWWPPLRGCVVWWPWTTASLLSTTYLMSSASCRSELNVFYSCGSFLKTQETKRKIHSS